MNTETFIKFVKTHKKEIAISAVSIAVTSVMYKRYITQNFIHVDTVNACIREAYDPEMGAWKLPENANAILQFHRK